MRKLGIRNFVLILAPFVLSFSFGLDIYIPITPQLLEIFSTTPAKIQLTLTLFLFFAGIGQLVVGPLCDRWGRKKTIYFSASTFILGALICTCSTHINILIAGRILSSLGACGMLVSAFAIVRDLYSGVQSAKVYSLLNGIVGISPTFAPIFGGYLAFYLGWRSIFLFLGAMGIYALVVNFFLVEETHSKENQIVLDVTILKHYWQILTNPEFYIFASLCGLAEGIFFGFFSISPFIIIDQLGVAPRNFGYFFAFFGLIIGFGGIMSARLIAPGRQYVIVKSSISLMFLGGMAMFFCHLFFSLTLYSFLIPMCIACFGAILMLGVATSLALEPFAHMAATASAMLGSIQFGLSALIGSIIMIFPPKDTLPYGTAIISIAFLSSALFIVHARSAVKLSAN